MISLALFAGKSTLCNLLSERLMSCTPPLRIAFLSLDDLYRTHAELQILKSEYPENKLLHGRGQPGTHDIHLGHQVLEQLKSINASPNNALEVPIYDKSLHNGQGDRLKAGRLIQGPLVRSACTSPAFCV